MIADVADDYLKGRKKSEEIFGKLKNYWIFFMNLNLKMSSFKLLQSLS